MATGARGMVSLEIAVLMSVVLVIATAVGWYLYTTFVASTVGQPRLGVVSAELSTSNGELRLVLINPGPVDVKLSMVEVAEESPRRRAQSKAAPRRLKASFR